MSLVLAPGHWGTAQARALYRQTDHRAAQGRKLQLLRYAALQVSAQMKKVESIERDS